MILMYKILLSFGLYTYFFYSLGNTFFRKDSDNVEHFSMIPLFTTGFISPLKTILNFILTGDYYTCYKYIIFETTNLANPYTCYYLISYLNMVLLNNFN
jgi:hypothetical protein